MSGNILTPELIQKVRKELEDIKARNYDIGEVSEEMKTLVKSVYGPDDYATSGYWVRAQDYIRKIDRPAIA